MARPFILGLSQRSRSFAALGVYDSFSNVTRRRLTMTVTGSFGTAALLGTRMSPVLFGMLGATPQVGRLLIPGDDLPERNRIIILSDRAWRAHYGSDPGVIGSSLTIDGRPYTLVGIMSPGFAFPDAQTDFWIPYTSAPGLAPSEPRSDTPNSYYADGVFARLRDGVTIEAASAETDALLRTLSVEHAAETRRNSGANWISPKSRAPRRSRVDEGRADRTGSSHAAHAGGRGRAAAAHRLRQSGHAVSRAQRFAPGRARGPQGAWRHPSTATAAVRG